MFNEQLEVCGQAELTAFKAALCEAGRPDLADWGWVVERNVFWAVDPVAKPWDWLDAPTIDLLYRACTLAHTLHDRRAHLWTNDEGKVRTCCPTCCADALTSGWTTCPTHPL